jgi:hypothetical protein
MKEPIQLNRRVAAALRKRRSSIFLAGLILPTKPTRKQSL